VLADRAYAGARRITPRSASARSMIEMRQVILGVRAHEHPSERPPRRSFERRGASTRSRLRRYDSSGSRLSAMGHGVMFKLPMRTTQNPPYRVEFAMVKRAARWG
jgi:hypothetical protein